MIFAPLQIAADHPAYAGHFAGAPILPGVVLLDAALHAIEQNAGRISRPLEVATAKFLSAVRPGEPLTLEHEQLPNGSVRFAIRTTDRPIAHGMLVPATRLTEPARAHQG
jgi:3-hydroxyacyl-[acyl-carrier-protein] dehydratase